MSPAAPRRPAGWRAFAALALAAGALIALVWATIFGQLGREHADSLRDTYRHNANLAVAFEEHTASTVRTMDQMLRFVADEYRVRGRAPNLKRLVRSAKFADEAVFGVLIMDASGRVVAASGPAVGIDLSAREYFAYHRDHDSSAVRVGAPIARVATGEPIVPISLRLSHADGRFAGVVVASLTPAHFSGFYRQVDLGEDGMLLVVGLDGTARARRIGETIAFGQDMRGSTLLAQQALAENGRFVSSGRHDGVRRYVSYRTLPGYGLVVAAATSENTALAAYRLRRDEYFAAAWLITLLVLLSAGLGARSVARSRRYLLEALRSEAQFRATFDQSAVGIAHVAPDGTLLNANRALAEISGLPDGGLIGRNFLEFKPPEERESARGALVALAAGRTLTALEVQYRRPDGSPYWASVTATPVRDPHGRLEYSVVMVQDISERRAAQDRVQRRAQFDLLTDLPNRALFHDRLTQALAQARRQGWSAAVLFLDLDRFKQVNDSLGHAAGDELLREVGRRLAGSVRAADTAARLGGDEFAVVLGQLAQPGDAGRVAEKILRAMATPMLLGDRPYDITVSIGIAMYPADADGDDDATLLHKADLAMLAAKRAGRNAYRYYDAQALAAA